MTRDCSLNSPKNTSFWFCFDIQNNICTQHVLNLYFSGDSVNNLLSYCGLTDSRIRASDTDLPVKVSLNVIIMKQNLPNKKSVRKCYEKRSEMKNFNLECCFGNNIVTIESLFS